MDGNEEVKDNKVAIEEAREGPVNNDIIVEGFGEKQQYPMREQRPLGEWWKNFILPQHSEERANVALIEGPLSWSEAIRHNMEKLVGNVRTSLYRVEKLRKSIALQVYGYSQSGSVEGGALDCS